MSDEVLIVGAGPSGLAMAVSLSKQGIPYKIIDKNTGPGNQSRAMTIHARILEMYAQFSFADRFVENGIIIDTIDLYKDSKHMAKIPLGKIGEGISPYPYVLTLPQDEHEEMLVDELQKMNQEISWENELLDFQDLGDSVIANIATPEGEITQSFSYICGCDGASGNVRKLMGLDFPGGTYSQMFFVADIDNGTELNDGSAGFVGEYFCLAFPLRTTGQLRLIGLIPEEFMDEGEAPDHFEVLIPHVEQLLNIKVNKVNWYSPYKSHHRVAEKFRVGRAFLCGDSAHIHSPAGGQGMNTGISDALNLAWKLASVIKGQASTALLDTYEPERIEFAKKLVDTTDRAFKMLIHSWSAKNIAIPYIAPKLLTIESLQKFMFKTVSQTNVDYRHSELSKGKSGKIHGGDRLPWLDLGETDNFEPLKSYGWQIHVYGELSQEMIKLGSKVKLPIYNVPLGKLKNTEVISENSVFLVRPDGYISVATNNDNLGLIENVIKKYQIQNQKGTSQCD